MKTAFKHQLEGIEILKSKRRMILADEMGLGKTFQAIKAAGEIGEGTWLILCPASLKINWRREILSVYPEDDVFVVESGPEKELPHVPWLIINYDMLQKYKGQLLSMKHLGQIDGAIADEAHYIKGAKTIRAKITLEILEGLENIFMLTGTPLMNRPAELFNLLKAIRHPLGKARTTFVKRYCGAYLKTIPLRGGKTIRFMDESGATHLDELREFTKDAILRRTKKEVLDLPPKIVAPKIIGMPEEYQKRYDTAFEDYIEFLANNPTVAEEGIEEKVENILNAKHLVELTKLKQVCSQAKLDAIVEDIRSAVAQGEKVIVFSQFTNTIDTLQAKLLEAKKASQYGEAQEPIKSVTLKGTHSMDERQASVDAFQNDETVKVFIGNIKAAGVGITLTRATIVMFADMEWSPELHSQAEDRAHRIGQEGTVNVYYYIIEETVEEDIVDILTRKKSIIKDVTEGPTAERWSKAMALIAEIKDETERERQYQELQREMEETVASHSSMAAEFLDRMKKKMGITR